MAEKQIAKKSERVHAFDKLEDLVGQYQKVTHWFGFDIFRDDYKLNGALFYSFFVTICYTVNCVSWAVVAGKKGDLNELLNSICCIFTSFQHQCKILSVIFCRQEIYAVHGEVLRLTRSATGEAETTFYKFNLLYEKIGKTIFYLYATAVGTFCINPLLSYIITGNVEPMFNVKFPGMDNDTVTGYIVNTIGGMMVMSNTGTVFAACDAWTCYYFLFTGEYEELIEQKIQYMNRKILESEQDGTLRNKKKLAEFHKMLIDSIKTSQDVEKFFNQMKFFEILCLGQISCISATMMCSIIVMKITGWVTLLTYIAAHFFQLAGYSIAGTYIETKYERLQVSIYSLPWFYLSIPDQKLFQFFLQNSQTPKKFYLMGAQSINVATGLAIVKSIYSVIIMLDNVI
uniref:Odorant receptor n=1 Tax=Bradysia odoriphaga TaxID=1564500 RepID=A0A6B9CBL6_9DIPT|nr:odorant receptor 2 [Bradysia odoriphaga]